MAFEPNKITEQHILDAVKKIDSETISLEPSTRFDVIVNGKAYPPKEVMRYAHELMNGEHIWERSGGEPTNKYFTELGFEIKNKSSTNMNEVNITGNIWKLGCNWGSGKPSFYNYIKEESIIIGVEDKKYSIGDLVVVTEGHLVKAIARINENPKPVTSNINLKPSFEKLAIEYDTWVNYANSEWYELEEDDIFSYQLQQGICKVQNIDIRNKVIDLWNSRNSNYWIFQGNPSVFDFETAIKNNLLEDWTVSAHKDKIKKGDKVILWISGKNSGCYSLAEVTSEAQNITQSKDSHLWKTEEKNPLKAGIKITHNIIETPLLWSKIKGTKGIENLKVGNQGTNFTATKTEFKTILSLINNTTASNNKADMQAKNIILYGPPGTGKTYNSIDKAVEIASPERFNFNNHKVNKGVFDELRRNGQIEFVTFHQNYSYEDFVVGIKPDVDFEQLRFKPHEGIFYKIAKKARENYLFVNGIVSNKSKFEYSLEKIQAQINTKGEYIIKMKTSSFYLTKIDSNEIEGIRKTDNKIYKFSINDVYNDYVKVIKDIDYLKTCKQSKAEYGFTIEEILKIIPDSDNSKLKNYVLIIDEINRANISKVFGELITLLEDDKRLGEENELKIILPNGEKEFGVPPNLYIIGTMNTADKSIALIDIALRRRFEFIGYYPKYEMLNEEESLLLKKVNEAVFKEKKSADYLIGHAYFMKGQMIQIVLQNKVVPLLMEYFSGKTDIVSKIFLDTNWNVTYNTTNFIWDISPR